MEKEKCDGAPKEHGVGAIEQAAVAGHDDTGVLDANTALDTGLEEVSHDREDAYEDTAGKCEGKRDFPDAKRPEEYPDEQAAQKAPYEALDVLVWGDPRRELVSSQA